MKEAIEAAVIYLTVKGLKDGQWTLNNEADWNSPVIQDYLREETNYALPMQTADADMNLSANDTNSTQAQ